MSYFDSKRIVGTNADRIGSDAISGGWKELGRTTLGSAGDTITVSSLPNKRYYMFLNDLTATGGTIAANLRLNNDNSGTVGVSGNYARRRSINGGSDNTYTNDVNMTLNGNTDTNPRFDVGYLANLSSKEKLNITDGVYQNSSGAGTAPTRTEIVNKWDNTSNAINRLDVVNAGTGNFDTGSEVVVLGWDPDDTHTDNFWEELASVQGNGTSTTLSSGTIPAKKYLWVQGFTGDAGGANNSALQFNSDTGSNYATRRNLDGGSDTTWLSQAYTQLGTNTNCFFNTFIINNSANEKLAITHWVQRSTAGAANAPSRGEFVGKWANTSNQITNVTLMQQTTSINWGTDVHLKVWGSN